MIKRFKQYIRRLAIPQQIALGFASTIFLGALLLTLPISSRSGEWTNFVDALFTATSAVCVTGQVTLNTAEHWNYFGSTVIITLIQIGGLGFMSVIVSLFIVLGKRMNLKQRLLLQESLGASSALDAQAMIRYIIKFAMAVQFIGAGVLAIDFIPRYGLGKGIYFSLFHAISAFNNAGFDLFGNSLEGFTQNPLVVLTIAFLIFFGGLGFIVWKDLLSYRKTKKLLVHTKITLITTLSILLFSFILFTISEMRNGTFGDLSVPNQLVNTFFMSVTPRTAGYANVNYANVSNLGIFLTLILMFIGASSGSTGGGIKVTTFATVILFVKAKLKRSDVNFSKRSIPTDRIVNALLIILIGIGVVFVASIILLLTETIPAGFGPEYVLMEVFSCFGTVGLTMGLTPDLTVIGKIVLIIVMFAGRIGMITFFLTLGNKPNKDSKIHYPAANILVG